MINYSTSMVLFGDPLLCPRQEEHTFLPFTSHCEKQQTSPTEPEQHRNNMV